MTGKPMSARAAAAIPAVQERRRRRNIGGSLKAA